MWIVTPNVNGIEKLNQEVVFSFQTQRDGELTDDG